MAQNLPTGNFQHTLAEIAKLVGGQVEGDPGVKVSRLTDLASCDADGIAFLEGNRKLEPSGPKPCALLIDEVGDPYGLPCIRVSRPREAFLKLLILAAAPLPLEAGIHPTAVIDASAIIDPSVRIGPYVCIGQGAVIGAEVRIHAQVSIGPECVIGKDSILEPGAKLVSHVRIGQRCLIHAGATLGTDGFGFFWNGSQHQKIPQVGRIEVGDDVEIGALTTVDRAMVGVTKIGSGCKLDNLIQVGHNVWIGENTVIAACCAIGGTAVIGQRCVVGGNTAFSDHVTVVDDVRIGGGSAVASSIRVAGDYFGQPARPAAEGKRNFVAAGRLAEMSQRIAALERKIAEIEEKQS